MLSRIVDFIIIAVILYFLNDKFQIIDFDKFLNKTSPKSTYQSPKSTTYLDKTIRIKEDAWHQLSFYTGNTLPSILTVDLKSLNGQPVDFFITDKAGFNDALYERRGYRKNLVHEEREIITISKEIYLPTYKTLFFVVHHAEGPLTNIFSEEKPAAAVQIKVALSKPH